MGPQRVFVPILAIMVIFVLTLSYLPTPASPPIASPGGIRHVVVIMEENHTFDNFFGTFPGANGVANDPPWAKSKVFVMEASKTDLCHSVACNVKDYDSGKMDGWTDPQAFGTYDKARILYFWQLAQNYTLLDNYFAGFLGPSLPNHIVAISGWNYNDTQDQAHYNGLPLTTTIFDLLNAANKSWAFYTGYCCLPTGFNPLPYSPHHLQAKPEQSFVRDLSKTGLSAVTYIMPPTDQESGHPPYNVTASVPWTKQVVSAIQASPYWSSTAILMTWDEGGGFYDHVAPPNATFDFRVPMIIISPYSRHGYIDHTFASHSSIPAFIEKVFGLPCMFEDCHSSSMMGALDLNQYSPAASAVVTPATAGFVVAGASFPVSFLGQPPDSWPAWPTWTVAPAVSRPLGD
jgi:phospholipase C